MARDSCRSRRRDVLCVGVDQVVGPARRAGRRRAGGRRPSPRSRLGQHPGRGLGAAAELGDGVAHAADRTWARLGALMGDALSDDVGRFVDELTPLLVDVTKDAPRRRRGEARGATSRSRPSTSPPRSSTPTACTPTTSCGRSSTPSPRGSTTASSTGPRRSTCARPGWSPASGSGSAEPSRPVRHAGQSRRPRRLPPRPQLLRPGHGDRVHDRRLDAHTSETELGRHRAVPGDAPGQDRQAGRRGHDRGPTPDGRSCRRRSPRTTRRRGRSRSCWPSSTSWSGWKG